MGIVAGSIVDSPTAHTVGHAVGQFAAYRLFVLDGVDQCGIGSSRKIFHHLPAVEYQFAVILFGAFSRHFHFDGFAVECFLDHLET